MQRETLKLSVAVAVLVLGVVIGWFAGEPATTNPSRTGQLPFAMEMVVEEDAADAITQVRKTTNAFQMPYFSFKVLLPQPPTRPGS